MSITAMMRVTLTCIALVATNSAVYSRPEPTLTLEFEEGMNGVGPRGQIVPQIVENPKLVPGKFGNALKSGPGTGYLRFPTRGIVSPEAGTVEMWVCPVDWNGNEEKFHSFFDVRGDGALYLYKYFQGGLLMLSCPNISGPYHSASADIGSWKPGAWHHIAGTWSRTRQCVYVDGKRIGTVAPNLPRRLDDTFLLGDQPWHLPRTSSSLVDRVRIYDRFLAEEQISAHFDGDYDKSVALSAQSSELSFALDPVKKTMSARIDILGADEGVDAARVKFSISGGNSQVAALPSQPFVGPSAVAEISVAGLKPGDYPLKALLTEGAKQVATLTKPFGVPSTDWIGNKIGLKEVVLPPWTPIKVSGRHSRPTISCWNRNYEFQRWPLPTQIVSKGKRLLARPVMLQVRTGGKALNWTAGEVRVQSATPTAAEVEGTTTAETPQGRVVLKAHTLIEYDGLMLVSLALDAPVGWKAETISLDVPMHSDVAFYRHRWSPEWVGCSGNLPPGPGVVDKASFLPYAWLGDNDRGLFWLCETAQHWPNWASPNAFETVREGGAVTLRFNLVGKGQSLPRPWRYQFGLQATPVKPLPKDWRKWRLQPAVGGNVAIVWPTPTQDSLIHYGYPEAADPILFAKRVNDFHAKGVRVVPYSCLTYFSDAAREWPWYSKSWSRGEGADGETDVAAYGGVFQAICPKSRTYADFIVAKNKEFMTRYGLDGFYHDNTGPLPCSVEATGCGWRDSKGALHSTYPILAFRSLYRRLYSMAKTARPDSFLIAHMSGKVTIPILAYEDAYLDGEQFTGRVKDSYASVLSLDTFRAEFMGRQWGVIPYFLPKFSADQSARFEPTRGLVGLLLLHDVPPWVEWCNAKPFEEAFNALDAFGFVNADFIPYFDPAPPAFTHLKDVYVSAYKRKDGDVLLLIVNLSKENQTGNVHLNLKRLGVPVARAMSWPEKVDLPINGTSIAQDVPGQGYRMVMVRKRID